MGVFLPCNEMWDLPIESHEGEKHLPHWLGNLGWVLVGGVFKVLFRYRVDGRENLRAFKDVSGTVVICNHTSFLDVVFMFIAARPSQWVRLMGRDKLFQNAHGLLGEILSRAGAFPVKRDSSDRGAIKRAAHHLKNGENIGILPEGTRRGKTTMAPKLHAGAAFIARMGGGVPIIPMTVRNLENVKRKGERVHFPKVSVEYGSPILLEDFSWVEKSERLEACTWYAMRECFALYYNVAPEDVDMVSLFPEDADYTSLFAEHAIPKRNAEELALSIANSKESNK